MNADTTLGVYFLRKFFLSFFDWLFSLHFSRDRTLLKQKSKLILQKTKKGERMQKERKKERKKENYCNSASYTQTSYTRAEREKGKERVESAGIGRSSSAFFIFSRSTSF